MKKILILLLSTMMAACAFAQRATTADYDTIPAKKECVVKFLTKQTVNSKGQETERIYCVYVDKENDIAELIPMTKAVKDYVEECYANGMKPNLGIKLKNGEIYSIIRLKAKIKTK